MAETMKTPVSFRPRPAPEPPSRCTEVAPEGTRDLLRYAMRLIDLTDRAVFPTEAFKDYERAKVRMQLWHTP